jgi:hypothetical protein
MHGLGVIAVGSMSAYIKPLSLEWLQKLLLYSAVYIRTYVLIDGVSVLQELNITILTIYLYGSNFYAHNVLLYSASYISNYVLIEHVSV